MHWDIHLESAEGISPTISAWKTRIYCTGSAGRNEEGRCRVFLAKSVKGLNSCKQRKDYRRYSRLWPAGAAAALSWAYKLANSFQEVLRGSGLHLSAKLWRYSRQHFGAIASGAREPLLSRDSRISGVLIPQNPSKFQLGKRMCLSIRTGGDALRANAVRVCRHIIKTSQLCAQLGEVEQEFRSLSVTGLV